MSDPSYQHSGSRPAWIGGAILILIGLFFLLRNMTGFSLNNWWALFILIPALTTFARAYSSYQAERRLSTRARSQILMGLALIFLASVFLFSLDFGSLWPLFVILAGVALLVNALLPE